MHITDLELSSRGVKHSQERIHTDIRLTFRAKIFLLFLSSSDPWWHWALVSLRCWWIFKRPQFTTNVSISYAKENFYHVSPNQIIWMKMLSVLSLSASTLGLDAGEKSMPADEDCSLCTPRSLHAFSSQWKWVWPPEPSEYETCMTPQPPSLPCHKERPSFVNTFVSAIGWALCR